MRPGGWHDSSHRPDDDMRAPDDADALFPLPPPQHDVDLTAFNELPAHVVAEVRSLVAEAAWLERRFTEDLKRLSRIEEESERTPRHDRTRRAYLLDRHGITTASAFAAHVRLSEIHDRIADMYLEVADLDDERARRDDHPTRDMARADVIRRPPPESTDARERDDATERVTRERDHSRSGR